jgi:membrane protein YdbS with pleckstrin-like domain
MKCEHCGGEAPATAAHCPSCGARLAENDGDPISEGRAKGAARLTARGGRNATSRPPEEELWSGTYSPKAMIGPVIGAAVLSILGLVAVGLAGGSAAVWWWLLLAIILMWVAIALTMLYRRLTVHYQLTTYRLFHETGLLRRVRNRIEVIDIDDVTLTQGIIERIFNVGTLHILSSDLSHNKLDMPGIENARYVADLIDNTRRAERERRGLFMENV